MNIIVSDVLTGPQGPPGCLRTKTTAGDKLHYNMPPRRQLPLRVLLAVLLHLSTIFSILQPNTDCSRRSTPARRTCRRIGSNRLNVFRLARKDSVPSEADRIACRRVNGTKAFRRGIHWEKDRIRLYHRSGSARRCCKLQGTATMSVRHSCRRGTLTLPTETAKGIRIGSFRYKTSDRSTDTTITLVWKGIKERIHQRIGITRCLLIKKDVVVATATDAHPLKSIQTILPKGLLLTKDTLRLSGIRIIKAIEKSLHKTTCIKGPRHQTESQIDICTRIDSITTSICKNAIQTNAFPQYHVLSVLPPISPKYLIWNLHLPRQRAIDSSHHLLYLLKILLVLIVILPTRFLHLRIRNHQQKDLYHLLLCLLRRRILIRRRKSPNTTSQTATNTCRLRTVMKGMCSVNQSDIKIGAPIIACLLIKMRTTLRI